MIKGLADDAPEGWVLQSYQVPRPKGLKGIMDAVESILKQKAVQSLTVEMGKPIEFTRLVRADEAEEARAVASVGSMSLGDVARNVPLQEVLPKEGRGPHETFFEMVLAISNRGLHVTHIGLGGETRFFEWLGVDPLAYGGITFFAGAEVVRDTGLPADNMILFAGPKVGGRADEITFALKCHLTIQDDLVAEEIDEQGASEEDREGGDGAGERRVPDGAVEDDRRGDVVRSRGTRRR